MKKIIGYSLTGLILAALLVGLWFPTGNAWYIKLTLTLAAFIYSGITAYKEYVLNKDKGFIKVREWIKTGLYLILVTLVLWLNAGVGFIAKLLLSVFFIDKAVDIAYYKVYKKG